MPRIAGINLEDQKPIAVALTAIYGVGRSRARAILEQAHIDPAKRASALSQSEIARIRECLEQGDAVEGDLRRRILANVKLLRDLGTYRGIRHSKRLPVRGQRTRTNSRTIRGNVRRTMTSGRRKLEKT